jgi:hypothetical protein
MARTVLSGGNRFTSRGNTKVAFIPLSVKPDGVALTLAHTTDPATVDLTAAIVPPITGFNGTQADIPAPDMGSLFTGTVSGEITIGESSLTFYMSTAGPGGDVRSVLNTGDEGWLLIGDQGIDPGDIADLCRVDVKFGTKMREDLLRIMIPFSIASIDEDITIPAI